MPDEPLRQAAAGGVLSTRQGIRAEVQRMLRDSRAQRTRHSFLERWLTASAVRTAPKPPENLAFNVELREALVDVGPDVVRAAGLGGGSEEPVRSRPSCGPTPTWPGSTV